MDLIIYYIFCNFKQLPFQSTNVPLVLLIAGRKGTSSEDRCGTIPGCHRESAEDHPGILPTGTAPLLQLHTSSL